jgi:hypothetical protein
MLKMNFTAFSNEMKMHNKPRHIDRDKLPSFIPTSFHALPACAL